MRRAAALGVLATVACGGTPPRRPDIRHDAPRTYVAGVGTSWTSPVPFAAVAVLDAAQGAVLSRDGTLVRIAFTDGALTPAPAPLPAGVAWQHLVWLGDALFALGSADRQLRLVRVDPATLTFVAHEAPAGAAAITDLAIAPDGAHAWACEGPDQGVVYDAAWQRGPVVKLDGCGLSRFDSPQRVLLGGSAAVTRAIAIGDGAITRATEEEVAKAVSWGAAWRRDGAEATWIRGDRLAVAAPGASSRSIDLPAPASRLARGAAGAPTLLAFGGYHLGVLDDGAAEVRTRTDGHLGAVGAVAPRGGQVVSLAERVLTWDAAGVRERGPRATRQHVGDPELPVLVASDDAIWAWIPGTSPRRLGDARAPNVLDRAGETVALDDLYTLTRLRDGDAEPWFTFIDDAQVADVDVGTGRVAFELSGGFAIARPDDGVAVPVPLLTCDGYAGLRLVRGQARALLLEEPGARLVDTSTGATTASVDLVDDVLWDSALVGADAVALLASDAVLLWHPADATLRRWPIDAAGGPAVLGASPDGDELAIGFDDGHVLWTRVDELRAVAATPAAPGPMVPEACPDAEPLPSSLQALRHTEHP